MSLSYLERMIHLADEVFASKNDPDQLDVNPSVLEHLQQIHPSTVCQLDEGHGPVAWILLIPTTSDLMNRFLNHEISEKELYEQTTLNTSYDALYLCSAMVLDEFRRKGIARRLTVEAVEKIREDHPIKSLFVWTFSREGLLSAEALAQIVSLPLYQRPQ